ncbi:hypothetical protein L228DRAFT_247369 [Xylona heveae TC161]|uniref:Pre-mRNA-splicing factor CWC24 n=1 Tax=Xylona heveae (strain CBS 132557 / TC161) TaxID=1328760 RepID=A0A165H3T5_XYLHT|nr:hypothetical protein L228DRAFT_247369 [Xylona heveae TC161]KZF22946.1 hypothetical protein L228DRAFT_247369 [Xylona heveae TC161]
MDTEKLASLNPPQGGDTATEAAPPVSLFKKRSAKSKSSLRKRPATPPPASDSDSDYTTSEEEGEDGRKIKRRRKHGGVVTAGGAAKTSSAGLEASTFTADRSGNISSANDATKQSNWFDESKEDNDQMSAKELLGSTRVRPAGGEEGKNDGLYKGSGAYQSFIQKNPDAPNKQVGPVKAPTNIRTITVTDYAPDVCKDYKQTGFCGFGDSCKFLHAREDYKQGWELDRDWEIGTKGKKVQGKAVSSAAKRRVGDNDDEDEEDEDDLLENIPFACIICRKPYKYPITTKCGHYFCEPCALQRYRKNPSCAACGAGTGGVFNTAKNLKRLLDKKRERARKRREKAIAEGEEVSSEEEGEGEGGDEE